MVLDIETIAVIIRITSGASIALYIVLLSLLCFKLKLQFMSKAFNIQFLLSNLIYSFSTVLPDVSTNTFLCKGQSMLTVFSELTTIGIGNRLLLSDNWALRLITNWMKWKEKYLLYPLYNHGLFLLSLDLLPSLSLKWKRIKRKRTLSYAGSLMIIALWFLLHYEWYTLLCFFIIYTKC